jgi:hypothetical protein
MRRTCLVSLCRVLSDRILVTQSGTCTLDLHKYKKLEESCLWAGRQYKGGEGTAPVKGSIFNDIVFPGVARKGTSSKSKDHKETAWC